MRQSTFATVTGIVLIASTGLLAQQNRPMSPRGQAATHLGGRYTQEQPDGPTRYVGGQWVEVDYGRPIKRGRDLFAEGANYGESLNDGAPVWRAGANQSTRFRTEVDLEIGGTRLPAGEYSLFVDLKPDAWTLILSNHDYQEAFDREEKVKLWGAYGYDQAMDVLRAPMTLTKNANSVDQFTIAFLDVTNQGGTLALSWDRELATIPFTLAK